MQSLMKADVHHSRVHPDDPPPLRRRYTDCITYATLRLASSAPGALTTRHPVMFTETHPEREGAPKDDMEPGPRTPSYTGNDGGKCAGVADDASMAWRTSHA